MINKGIVKIYRQDNYKDYSLEELRQKLHEKQIKVSDILGFPPYIDPHSRLENTEETLKFHYLYALNIVTIHMKENRMITYGVKTPTYTSRPMERYCFHLVFKKISEIAEYPLVKYEFEIVFLRIDGPYVRQTEFRPILY